VFRIPSQYVDILSVTTQNKGTMLYQLRGEELRIAWFSLIPMKLSTDEKLLSIKCLVKEGTESFTGAWQIDPVSQLADEYGEVLRDVKLTMPEVVINARHCYLAQNIPNPFTHNTDISWFMPSAGDVVLKIYDLLGNEILTIADGTYEAGSHSITLDASGLKSGTYNYRIMISGNGTDFIQTKKFVLIK
jgi:hypothetical protein